jgi:phosphatidylserine/phosphatidylglycerophosphate/cardiolipin synthase-like enzyme
VKRRCAIAAILVCLLAPATVCVSGPVPITVYFSPSGDSTKAIVTEIDHAEHSLRVLAYYFTSAPIAKSVIDAKRRGLDVQVILDKSQRTQKYSSADFLVHAGVPTFIDSAHAIMHNKIIVIDDAIVMTGSFNFTKAAEEKNAENLLVIRDSQIAKQYLDNWALHRQHSERYSGK